MPVVTNLSTKICVKMTALAPIEPATQSGKLRSRSRFLRKVGSKALIPPSPSCQFQGSVCPTPESRLGCRGRARRRVTLLK